MKKRLLTILMLLTILSISACSKNEDKQIQNDNSENNLINSETDNSDSSDKSEVSGSPDTSDNIDTSDTTDTSDITEPSNSTTNPKDTAVTVMTNPMIWADVPDPDIIRVGEYYYMISTTMHFNPGVPIMRSTDLANWEIVSYVYDTLADGNKQNLIGGENMYGKGSWAASLRYHEDTYYVCFASYDTGKTYIYQTKSLEDGSWNRAELSGVYHDPSLLFDDDGRVYMIYGAGKIRAIELNEDLTGLKYAGLSFNLLDVAQDGYYVNFEGCHAYKIDGYYYIFGIVWPNNGSHRRTQWCYRSKALFEEFEGKPVFDDSFNYQNSGVAQGGIVDTPQGDYYTILFQDHGAVGRIPILLPLVWEDGWPIIGENGTTPLELRLVASDSEPNNNIVSDNEFDYDDNNLLLSWQWNHNPDNSMWSFTERPGYLRLANGHIAQNIFSAKNTLTQRTLGPSFTSEVKLDTSGMKSGDYAGMAAFQNKYGMLGVKVSEDSTKHIILGINDGNGNLKEQYSLPLTQDEIYFKIEYIFNSGSPSKLNVVDKAYFYYSLDGDEWIKIDYTLSMTYTLDHFVGYRTALFSYATSDIGGYSDFDYYRCKIGELNK